MIAAKSLVLLRILKNLGCHGQPVARDEAETGLGIMELAEKATQIVVTRATGCPWHPYSAFSENLGVTALGRELQ